MNQQQRRRLIEQSLEGAALVTVDELATKLAASAATIRRDISALARAGRLRRVRGGAETLPAPANSVVRGPDFEARRQQNLARKRAIAARAAELCAPGEAVIINGGTTTYCLGEFIAHHGLHVLTNSFALASYLAGSGNCRVLLPGGQIYPELSLVLSPYPHDTVIDHFDAACLLTSAHAIRPQGLVENDPILIKSEQKLMERAERVIALVDGSKFARRGSLIMCALARLERVVTDSSAPPEGIAMLRDAGVAVEVVDAG